MLAPKAAQRSLKIVKLFYDIHKRTKMKMELWQLYYKYLVQTTSVDLLHSMLFNGIQ